MRPDAYAALYGPWQPAQQVRVPVAKERPAVAALAALLWAVTLLSVSWVGGLLSIALIWGAAAGQPIAELLLWFLPLPAGAVGLAALARAPGVRRLAVSTRVLLLGALACPVPAVLAVRLWFLTG
ncbi:hypothetical protein [Streptomyces sp. DSM 40907]|uniref:hypothetical protein n=1 Tax=Streptomyces kutzneri TaxID=3051179 RepID=UPI0028D796DC|nr:hypothetical protein [Streptomyces sp. DSM 40907]